MQAAYLGKKLGILFPTTSWWTIRLLHGWQTSAKVIRHWGRNTFFNGVSGMNTVYN